MKKKTIWLRTVKNVGYDIDNDAIKEKSTVKLMEGKNFSDFIKVLPNMGLSKKQPTKVVGVYYSDDAKKENILTEDVKKYQAIVDKALKTEFVENKDYKLEYEKTNTELQKLRDQFSAKMAEFEAKLAEKSEPKATEREKLESKAKELDITFRSDIGDEKLLGKIIEVEPEFKIS